MTFTTEEQISQAVRDSKTPLIIQGGGTRQAQAPSGPILSLAGYSGIDLYEPEALTLIAKAGTPMDEIAQTLEAQGQMLAFEPMDHRVALQTQGIPTIGGAIAGNVSGPRRIAAGAARDFILGARFVTGSDDIVKNGGRVMKNVTGYDLSRLLAGSWGQLAAITQIALKTLPKPQATQTLCIEGLTAATARDAMTRAMGLPYDVSGATSTSLKGKMTTYLRLEGLGPSVERRIRALQADLASFGASVIMGQEASEMLWPSLRDVAQLAAHDGDIWAIHTSPSHAPDVCAQLTDDYIMDWAGARIWACVPKGSTPRSTLTLRTGHMRPLRAHAAPFEPQSGSKAALAQAVKTQFDPQAKFAGLSVDESV